MGKYNFNFSLMRQLSYILKRKKLYTLCLLLVLVSASIRLGITLAQGYLYTMIDNQYINIAIILINLAIAVYCIVETFRIGAYMRRTGDCRLTRHRDYSVTFICTDFMSFKGDYIVSEWHLSNIKAILKTKDGYKLYGTGIYIPDRTYRKKYIKVKHILIPEWFDNMDKLKDDLSAAISYSDMKKRKQEQSYIFIRGTGTSDNLRFLEG